MAQVRPLVTAAMPRSARRFPVAFGPAERSLPPRRRAALWKHLLFYWAGRSPAFLALAPPVPLLWRARERSAQAQAARRGGRPPRASAAAIQDRLDDHVDALRSAGVRVSRSQLLSALLWQLPADVVRAAVERAQGTEPAAPLRLRSQTLAEYHRQIVADALRRHRDNVTAAAAELGVSRRAMYNWIRRDDGREARAASSTT